VRVFGGLALESDGVALEPPASRRARELLGWLALNPGRHARAAVAARFWPDVLDASARASLRTTLHALRRALGDAGGRWLVATRDSVGLRGDLWVDVHPVTNAAFRRFVNATGYVTVAEQAPPATDFPGARPEDLVPGSLVFTGTLGPVALDDWTQWWSWVPSAD